ncbi:MAG: FAD-binding oxidoreductase [Parvibaculaceae bacterium]
MTHQVTICYSDGVARTIPLEPDETVLEAADAHGVPIVSECLSGVCGTCVGRCTGGHADMAHAVGLSAHEIEQGRILNCQTRARSDCTIELDYPFAGNAARMVSGTARIVELEHCSPGIVRLSLDVSGLPSPLTYKAGQFAQLRVPGTQAWRTYSYVGMQKDDATAEFLIRLQPDGAMSEYLTAAAAVGDEIDIRGSKGGFYLRHTVRPVLLIAGGTGLSAILAIAEELVREHHARKVHLIYGVTGEQDLVLQDRLERLERASGLFSWQAIVAEPSPTWAGATGLATDALDLDWVRAEKPEIYLCGPEGMVTATRALLERENLGDVEIFFEKFAPSRGSPGEGQAAFVPPDPEWLRREAKGTAIVIGGSIAGMATAKMLSDRYDRVIVLEKDPVHHRMEGRPGAAQGWHLHHLLIAGQRQLETVFPGIIDDMTAAGAFRVDMGEQYRLMLAGTWKKRARSGIEIICAARPLLEWCVRRRLDGEDKVDYRYGNEAVDLFLDEEHGAVTGVLARVDGELVPLAAEFVVDASGKNTAVPAMLGRLTGQSPEIEEDCLNCFYSTMQHRVPASRVWHDKVMVICYAHRPYQQYYAAQYYTDTSRTVLSTSLVGYNCYEPPRNAEEFREFARRMSSQEIGDELDGLEPVSDVFNFRYPEMRRYHYERMRNLPAGLVAIGDAFCSADPVSGAGMTKALLELNELRDVFGNSDPASPRFVKRYYRRVAKIADSVWFVIREQNLRYPWIRDVERKRPFYFPLLNWYVDRILELLHEDPEIYRHYLSISHFVEPPTALMRPWVAMRVVAKWLRSRLSAEPGIIERNFGVGPVSRSGD